MDSFLGFSHGCINFFISRYHNVSKLLLYLHCQFKIDSTFNNMNIWEKKDQTAQNYTD